MMFLKIMCSQNIQNILAFSTPKYLWLTLAESIFQICRGISNILFLLDSNLWQHYHIVLCFSFLKNNT